MKKTWLVPVILCVTLGAFAQNAVAQDAGRNALPVTAVSLYSSGIGYYEHAGSVRDIATVPLVFDSSAINDVLKSLVVSDSGGGVPSVRYPAEDTLLKTLQSLSIDLSGASSLADILGGMRGAEIRISGPSETVGRIVCVERKGSSGPSVASGDSPGKDYLTVSTASGIASYDLAEIPSFSFTDPTVEADLARALDLIAATRNDSSKTLLVTLPGKGPRNVTIGYVAPAPVWKASYRLDLSGGNARVQGWAIIDNTGEMDWQNIRLSLVTGKPVSFIQNLYAPYYYQRPVVPLAIAGAAEAMTYGSGVAGLYAEEESLAMDYAAVPSAEPLAAPSPKMSKSIRASSNDRAVSWSDADSPLSNAAEAGDFFSYTMPTPVSIPRRQSAMLPFVEAKVTGEKMSVFSAGAKHPMFCVQLTNTSGMKLPAGPMTVFDDGSYSGDALVEFFPQNDKRILAFGEDLAVSCAESSSVAGFASSMTVSKGVLTIARKNVYAKTYDFINADAKERKLVVEHPITQGATLVSPTKFRESTVALYRFDVSLPANGKATLTVREEKPDWRNVSLVSLDAAALLSYSASSDVTVKAALERAVALRRKTDDANVELQAALTRKNELVENQGRIRDNLLAAGNETQQGKDYLKKLAQADVDIDKASEDIALARKKLADANDAFKNYISTLDLK
jgi:hypothetical protein